LSSCAKRTNTETTLTVLVLVMVIQAGWKMPPRAFTRLYRRTPTSLWRQRTRRTR